MARGRENPVLSPVVNWVATSCPKKPGDMANRVRHYRIQRKIGSGGMATVYEAVDMRSQARVALKVLHPHLADQPTYVARFLREAQMAIALRSPYIVKMLESGQEKDLHYLAMEYISGATLQRFVQQLGALPVSQALDITYQVAQALEEAHRHGIVHRDIKPQNIMITPDGAIKVMDFGIARAMMMDSMTMTGMFMGTPHYSSPEQATGDPVDIRSDIYSLGVVLYQLLTGTVPFQADTPQALLLRVMQGNPVPVQLLRVDLPGRVVEIVEKMLRRDPAQRYQSPEELGDALRPLLRQRREETLFEMATMVAPLVSRSTSQTSPREFGINNAFFWGAGGVIVLAVLVLTLMIWKPWTPTPPLVANSETTPVPVSDSLSTDASSDGLVVTSTITATLVAKASSTSTRMLTSRLTSVGATPTATSSQMPSESADAPEWTPARTSVPPAVVLASPTPFAPTPTAVSRTGPSPSPTIVPPTPAPPPGLVDLMAPVLAEPQDGSTASGNVVLRWEVVPGAIGYRVETRSDRPGQEDWRVWPVGLVPELYIAFEDHADYFKDPGTVYQWRVVAVDVAGELGAFSQPFSFTFQRDEPKPEPPPAPTAKPNPPTPVPAPTEKPPPPPPSLSGLR